jgi:hypothetical protein
LLIGSSARLPPPELKARGFDIAFVPAELEKQDKFKIMGTGIRDRVAREMFDQKIAAQLKSKISSGYDTGASVDSEISKEAIIINNYLDSLA